MTADPEDKEDETDDDTHPGECGSGPCSMEEDLGTRYMLLLYF